MHEAQYGGCRKKLACEALGIDIRTIQRWKRQSDLNDKRNGPNQKPAHTLTEKEHDLIIKIANTAEFADLPPCQIVPKLADQGKYIASESSFYRVLSTANQNKYRGRQKKPSHSKPQPLKATMPNQVWSWDISYLPTCINGLFFYLYFFIDIYSRKIVGYEVYDAERASYAEDVIKAACLNENIQRHQITLHSDNGSPMKASTFLTTLRNLGVATSFSRPSVSNDNAYSEALFKTTKNCRWYPKTPFSSLDDARKWVMMFVEWYNNEHLHSGLKFLTPNTKHQGSDYSTLKKRAEVYQLAKNRNPNRWVNDIRNWALPNEVFLNPTKQIQTKVLSCY